MSRPAGAPDRPSGSVRARWVPLLVLAALCSAWCSSARAIGAIGTGLLYVVPDVPSDGVLVLYGYCEPRCEWARTVTVTDLATGQLVAGQVSAPHDEDGTARVTFTPEVAPLAGATLRVGAPIEQGSGPAFDVHIIQPSAFDLTSVKVDFTITSGRTVLASECCPNLFGLRAIRCLDTSVLVKAVVRLRVTSQQPVAAQWLYELSSREPGEAPFAGAFAGSSLQRLADQSGWSTPFDGSAASYCYQVRVSPIAGGEVTVLDAACLGNELREVGKVARSPEEIARFLDTCEKPPLEQSGSATGTGSRVNGDAGPSSPDGSGSTPIGDGGQGRWVQNQGCQLAASQPTGSPLATLVWSLATLLLCAHRRRRSVP